MNQSQDASTSPKLELLNKFLRVFFIFLFAFNLILLALELPPFLHGEPDTYYNQHSRSVVGTIGQLLLCSCQIFFLSAQASVPTMSIRRKFFMSTGAILLIASFVSLYFSFRLAR